MVKRTGKDGAIYYVKGTSTALTDEAMGQQTNLPGDTETYAAKTLYSITDRTKFILDPSVNVSIKDGATVVKPTNYQVHYGSGYVEFFTPLATGTTVTISGAYIPRTGTDIAKAVAVRNWTFTDTRGEIDAGDYDTGDFDEYVVGSANGTFGFEQISTGDTTLFNKFRRAKLLCLVFFEDVKAPFYWVCYGTLREFGNGAPRAALNAGAVQGRLTKHPEPLLEAF
jgi:hypothetical protein